MPSLARCARSRIHSPPCAAHADEVLAQAAPELRTERLARKADALEKKLGPEGARARRERAKRDGQRVEVRREASGNASLAGRELDVADVLAQAGRLAELLRRLGCHSPAASADLDHTRPWRDYGVPALGSISSAELVL